MREGPPSPASPPQPQGCERSVITYSSLISACEKAGEWKLALQVGLLRLGGRTRCGSWQGSLQPAQDAGVAGAHLSRLSMNERLSGPGRNERMNALQQSAVGELAILERALCSWPWLRQAAWLPTHLRAAVLCSYLKR